MRTLGTPSASTVASDMAVGSRGSARTASSNHAANSRKGSSAWVKSPDVNQSGCLIGAESDILRSTQVVALVPGALSQQHLYSGRFRRWHAALRLVPLFALSLALGGCSFSYQLDNLFSKKDDPAQTASLRPTAAKEPVAPPHESDLAIARAAVAEILSRGGKDTSMPWENPKTGARGTITPLAQVYRQDGATCRDFLASYVRDGNESWLQGEACRPDRGKWEVRNMRPWKST